MHIDCICVYICLCRSQPFALAACVGSETVVCPSGPAGTVVIVVGWQVFCWACAGLGESGRRLLDIIFGKRKTFLNCGNASTKFALPSAR